MSIKEAMNVLDFVLSVWRLKFKALNLFEHYIFAVLQIDKTIFDLRVGEKRKLFTWPRCGSVNIVRY